MKEFMFEPEKKELSRAEMDLIEEKGKLMREIRDLKQKAKVSEAMAVLNFADELCKCRVENDNVVIAVNSLKAEWIKKWNENTKDVIIVDKG